MSVITSGKNLLLLDPEQVGSSSIHPTRQLIDSRRNERSQNLLCSFFSITRVCSPVHFPPLSRQRHRHAVDNEKVTAQRYLKLLLGFLFPNVVPLRRLRGKSPARSSRFFAWALMRLRSRSEYEIRLGVSPCIVESLLFSFVE